MEYLRWILLVIGIVLVLLVYLWGRSRNKTSDYSPLDAANDVPSFSARDASDDEWRDGVGPVRVVHREDVEHVIADLDEDDLPETVVESNTPVAQATPVPTPDIEAGETPEQRPSIEPELTAGSPDKDDSETEPEPDQQAIAVDDVVALYIVADRGHELKGEQILGACVASHLDYGDMKIFHRLDDRDKIVFSLANMMEPGWFDYDAMHELKTRGITLFTQLKLAADPVQALDDMLVCAHSLATMLDAQLCGPDRQLLNEVTAKSLREKAKYFLDLKQANS